jgi:hypothetical protein
MPAAQWEQFYIGVSKFGGLLCRQSAERALKPFLAWGYLCNDLPVNKASAALRTRTLLGSDARQAILLELGRSHDSFTVEDYLRAAGPGLHRRQAQRDIRRWFGGHTFGETRARRYRLRK